MVCWDCCAGRVLVGLSRAHCCGLIRDHWFRIIMDIPKVIPVLWTWMSNWLIRWRWSIIWLWIKGEGSHLGTHGRYLLLILSHGMFINYWKGKFRHLYSFYIHVQYWNVLDILKHFKNLHNHIVTIFLQIIVWFLILDLFWLKEELSSFHFKQISQKVSNYMSTQYLITSNFNTKQFIKKKKSIYSKSAKQWVSHFISTHS